MDWIVDIEDHAKGGPPEVRAEAQFEGLTIELWATADDEYDPSVWDTDEVEIYAEHPDRRLLVASCSARSVPSPLHVGDWPGLADAVSAEWRKFNEAED